MPLSNSLNRLLASLPQGIMVGLHPHLQSVDLPQGTVLFDAGDAIDRVYFPYSGIVSFVVSLASGETVEAAMIGRESLAGGSAALNSKLSLTSAIMQIGGSGVSLETSRIRSLAAENNDFRTMLVRHDEIILAQAQQSVACNAVHNVEARLARWLLRCRDLVDSDDLPLTQEFLGQMLGSRRNSVSLVASTFQRAGYIRYSRGNIRILDVEGLRDTACECYETIRVHADRLLKLPRDL